MTHPLWHLDLAADMKPGADTLPAPRQVIAEVPVAIEYGWLPYSVTMASPADLEDFVTGFSASEGLIATPQAIQAIAFHETDEAITASVVLRPPEFQRLLRLDRQRKLRSHTSCGVCGVSDLAGVSSLLPPARPPRTDRRAPSFDAIQHALQTLRDSQPLSRLTHCAHAAIWADMSGRIRIAREDVGRHNALDKLIGARMRQGMGGEEGFCLISSRCSFEMVSKAAAAGIDHLVSIGAATSHAIRTAHRAGMMLMVVGNGMISRYSPAAEA